MRSTGWGGFVLWIAHVPKGLAQLLVQNQAGCRGPAELAAPHRLVLTAQGGDEYRWPAVDRTSKIAPMTCVTS